MCVQDGTCAFRYCFMFCKNCCTLRCYDYCFCSSEKIRRLLFTSICDVIRAGNVGMCTGHISRKCTMRNLGRSKSGLKSYNVTSLIMLTISSFLQLFMPAMVVRVDDSVWNCVRFGNLLKSKNDMRQTSTTVIWLRSC